MIDYLYEKERREYWHDALEEWVLDHFQEWCEAMARSANEKPYTYLLYTARDIKRTVKEELK